jgi:hypothetical protein
MPLRTAQMGDTVQYRNAKGGTQNVVVRGVAGAAPATPSSSTAGAGGTLLDSTTYGYKLTAIVNGAETAASAQKTQATGAAQGNDNTVTIDWAATPVTGATAYRIYGRTNNGPWGLLAEVSGATTSYVDTGAATPGVAAPMTTDHVGFKGTHDRVARTTVLKATGAHQTDRYYLYR